MCAVGWWVWSRRSPYIDYVWGTACAWLEMRDVFNLSNIKLLVVIIIRVSLHEYMRQYAYCLFTLPF